MFKNFKVGMKLTVGFAIVLVLMCIITVTSFWGINSIGAQVSAYSQRTMPNVTSVWQIKRNLVSVQRYMLLALAENDISVVKQHLDIAESEAEDVNKVLTEYKKTARAEPEMLNSLETAIVTSGSHREEISRLLERNTPSYKRYGTRNI